MVLLSHGASDVAVQRVQILRDWTPLILNNPGQFVGSHLCVTPGKLRNWGVWLKIETA